MAAMFASSESGDPDEIAAMLGPLQVDQSVRQAIQFCWMGLPKERRTADELEMQIRRIVDRALRDFRDDETAFRPGG